MILGGEDLRRRARRGRRAPSPQRVQLLEISQYLESYLWPHFDADSSTRVHVLSIAAMVNQKRREGVSPWDPFRAAGSERSSRDFSDAWWRSTRTAR